MNETITLHDRVVDLAGKLGVELEQHPHAASLYRAVPTIEEDLGEAGEWQSLDSLWEALVSRAGEIPGLGQPDPGDHR